MSESGNLAHPGVVRLYVLRLWRADPSASWRATVRLVLTGAELHFASLDRLVAFLRAETGDDSSGSENDSPGAGPSTAPSGDLGERMP